MDADVRRLVLGPLCPATVEPAILKGWRRVMLPGVTYPSVIRDAEGAVEGVVTGDLTAGAKRRLLAYEGKDYDLIEVDVATGGETIGAWMFAGTPIQGRRAGEWKFALWQRRHKRRFVATLARRGAPS